MKFAQKMILVPEGDYSMVIKAQAQQIPATVKKSIHLQDNMKKLLKSKKKTQCKAYRYNKLLREYLHYKNTDQFQNTSKTSSSITEPFADSLPPIYKGKARVLLAHLEKHGINWSQKGELTLPDGSVISGSHGSDLLREALVGSRNQDKSNIHGWDIFLKSLADANIPESMIGKKATLSQIRAYKTTPKSHQSKKENIAPSWIPL